MNFRGDPLPTGAIGQIQCMTVFIINLFVEPQPVAESFLQIDFKNY